MVWDYYPGYTFRIWRQGQFLVTVYQSKYRSATAFGKTGINRQRFDMLWRHVRWSHQPDIRDEGTIHEDHRWKLVEDFVTHSNEYRTQLFSPSDIICADESISRWYGQGGHWINLGFPMYATMGRKPENGEEIHNYSYGRSGIMMQLRIVKSAKNEEDQQYDRDNLPNGKRVLKELMMTWDNTYRIVCKDS